MRLQYFNLNVIERPYLLRLNLILMKALGRPKLKKNPNFENVRHPISKC